MIAEHGRPTRLVVGVLDGRGSPNAGVVAWLLACPEKGFFVSVASESTDSL